MSSKTSEKSEDILVSSSSSSSSDSDSHQQVDRCVSEAEKLWKEKQYDEALKEYERALTYARGDEVREGTICLGIGFAMLSLKDRKKSAIEYLNRSLEVAERQGQKGQVDFVSHLIRETRKNLEKDEDDMKKASKAAANAFAKTVGIDTSSSDNVALLFNLSKTPERRSDKFANICQALSAKIISQTQLTPVGETR